MIYSADKEELLSRAANVLSEGRLVAFPTETVYGLGADAKNLNAVSRIFAVKNRPKTHPLIVHVANLNKAKSISRDWPKTAEEFAKTFWPGPLTLVVKKNDDVPDFVTGGQDSVAIRIPAHSFALKLLKLFDERGSGLVAAPSANRFGGVSATRYKDVEKSIGRFLHAEDLIIPSASSEFGLESTILDFTSEKPRILRLGALGRKAINLKMNTRVVLDEKVVEMRKMSGSLKIHYSPVTPLFVLSRERIDKLLITQKQSLSAKIVYYGFTSLAFKSKFCEQIIAPISSVEYARTLYSLLFELDDQGFNRMFFERPPETIEWEVIVDRLERASSKYKGLNYETF